EPPRPSTRVAVAASTPASVSRRPDIAGLAKELRRDLDWITMRALAKDRTRRYGAATDLAADVRRHLGNQPVLAGPPSTIYRATKFVRRHRVGVAIATSTVALLVGFAATVSWQARRIALERDMAGARLQQIRSLSALL